MRGVGSYRVNGPTGRDQTYVPGGDPTQRKGQAQGGKGNNNKNRVGGVKGAGVGFGNGGGGGGVGGVGSVQSWLGGGGGGAPLPLGIVLTEGEQAQACMNYLQAWLKRDQEIAQFHSMFEGKVPAVPEPAPAQTPTESQRPEVFAQLTRRRDGLVKRVKDGKDKLEAARARVRQEEAAVEELKKEFKTVSEQMEAHRAEDRRRAEEAKGPRVVEMASDNHMVGCSSAGKGVGVDQGAGKRRKVLRSNRTPPGKLTKEELLAIFVGMPNTDRDWFLRHFIGEDAVHVDTPHA